MSFEVPPDTSSSHGAWGEESEDEMERKRAHTVPSQFKVEPKMEMDEGGCSWSPGGNLDHKQGGSYSDSRSFRNAWGNESYATIITSAINSAPSKKMKLSNIYRYFESTFEYFAHNKEKKGWKNSVRHNLSLGKQFKRQQSSDPKEKGSFWYVDDSAAPSSSSASSSTPRSSSFSASGCRKKSTQLSAAAGRTCRAKSENSLLANSVSSHPAPSVVPPLLSRSPAPSMFAPAPPPAAAVSSHDDLQMDFTHNNNNNFLVMHENSSFGCHRQRAQTAGATMSCDPPSSLFAPQQEPPSGSHFLETLHPLSMDMMSPPIATQAPSLPRPTNLAPYSFSTADGAWRNPLFESHFNPEVQRHAASTAPAPVATFTDLHSNFASPPPPPPPVNTFAPVSSVNDLQSFSGARNPGDPGDFHRGFQNMRLAPINAFCASSYECADIGQIHPTINELIYDNPMLITSSE